MTVHSDLPNQSTPFTCPPKACRTKGAPLCTKLIKLKGQNSALISSVQFVEPDKINTELLTCGVNLTKDDTYRVFRSLYGAKQLVAENQWNVSACACTRARARPCVCVCVRVCVHCVCIVCVSHACVCDVGGIYWCTVHGLACDCRCCLFFFFFSSSFFSLYCPSLNVCLFVFSTARRALVYTRRSRLTTISSLLLVGVVVVVHAFATDRDA